MATNKRKVLVTAGMAEAGLALLKARGDLELVAFPHTIKREELQALMRKAGEVDAAILGVTPFGEPECELAKILAVVARIGVGYDAVDVPALTRRRIPLMIAGTANSPSVAEQAVFMMLSLAKKAAHFDAMVREARWGERMASFPVDLNGKTLLVVGFGRIGARTARRCLAMEMAVLVYDPYLKPEAIEAAGCESVAELDKGLPRADFVTIHCPRTPETVGMFNARRLALMRPTAYLVNTARGGIIDEPALHKALTTGKLAGAGLDVFEAEPTPKDNPLLRLPNVVCAPHMAGVTREAMDRMAIEAARNVLGVLDGKPNRDNVVNKEVLA